MKKVFFTICEVVLCISLIIVYSGSAWAQADMPSEQSINDRIAKMVNLDADDAYLPAVLTILAKKSGFNIVTGPGVNKQERISVHIKDTPIEEAINLVVRAAGLSYEIVGNSFLVAKAEALEKEVGLAPHVFSLQYANASEIKELLSDLTEFVQVDTSGNRILTLASPKVAAEIRQIIDEVDIAPMQILLEARLIEVATDDLDEYGIDWEKLSHLTTIIAESPVNPASKMNSEKGLSSRAPGDFYYNIDEKLTGGLDDLTWNPSGQLPEGMPFQKIDGLNNIGLFSRQLSAFDITLDFLLKRNVAKLLANTKLTTVNNRSASILIGETFVWAVSSERNAIVRTEEVGIRLNITPTINSGGYITTKVEPEVSSIIELIAGIYPRKKIRTASTTVLVKDGQKIFIGGLLSVDDTRNEYRMPILGDIPLIGKLFRHTEYGTKKTDLIIEITPRIIKPGIDYSDASNFTTDGYQLTGPGEITNFREIQPELGELEKIENRQEEIREFQNKALTPKE